MRKIKMKRIILLLVLGGFLIVGIYFVLEKKNQQGIGTFEQEEIIQEKEKTSIEVEKEKLVEEPNVLEENIANKKIDNIISGVPFVLQAPFANWDDSIFQDACEEAAILMVNGWLEKKAFSKQQMHDEIIKIVQLEKELLGEYVDASAEDTALIMKKYSKYEKITVVKNIELDDLKKEIVKGNLVVIPTNGQKLKNPFYTAPGPITHMIAVIGYDSAKKEFVTNDSGTKRGENYRYGEDILFSAIRDYPTGNHNKNPFSETKIAKNMIIVEAKNENK